MFIFSSNNELECKMMAENYFWYPYVRFRPLYTPLYVSLEKQPIWSDFFVSTPVCLLFFFVCKKPWSLVGWALEIGISQLPTPPLKKYHRPSCYGSCKIRGGSYYGYSGVHGFFCVTDRRNLLHNYYDPLLSETWVEKSITGFDGMSQLKKINFSK